MSKKVSGVIRNRENVLKKATPCKLLLRHLTTENVKKNVRTKISDYNISKAIGIIKKYGDIFYFQKKGGKSQWRKTKNVAKRKCS